MAKRDNWTKSFKPGDTVDISNCGDWDINAGVLVSRTRGRRAVAYLGGPDNDLIIQGFFNPCDIRKSATQPGDDI